MYQILFWKNIVLVTLVRQVLWLEKSSDDWLQDKKNIRVSFSIPQNFQNTVHEVFPEQSKS
jgi:hypothetical protein